MQTPLNFNFYLALMRRGWPAERIVHLMEADLGILPTPHRFDAIRAAFGLVPA